MSVRALLAAAIVVSVPIAVNGAEPQTTSTTPDPQAKRICTVRAEIGSRIKSIRTCRTAAETEEARQEQRRVIDRVQANKVSFGQ